MPANSTSRRAVKRLLHPVLSTKAYEYVQSVAVVWDIRSGRYPEPELELIPLMVKPGDTALDIGANYGFYTYHLSRAVGGSGSVYAFEPVPFTREVLEIVAKVLRLHNVTIVARGCSDQAGRFPFLLPVQASGAVAAGLAHMVTTDGSVDEPSDRFQQVWCNVVALDEFLPEVADLTFIKCDIEGAELLAMKGAEQLIRRHRPTILCEVNSDFLVRFGLVEADVAQFFGEMGYAPYRYDGSVRRLDRVVSLEGCEDGNYLFIHPSRVQALSRVLR